jgi:hypothetical protein
MDPNHKRSSLCLNGEKKFDNIVARYFSKQVSLNWTKNMIEQVAYNKSSLLLRNILQNTQTLGLFTMKNKTVCIYKSY